MEKDVLKSQILDLFAKGDNQGLKDLLNRAMAQLRDKAISEIESLLTEVEGKFRLKLLEILMLDGGVDLIPMFINCIRSEQNSLYAKSQILLFRGFKHPEALPALLSIEEDIHPDLQATYQRSLGKLLSRFSEQFYISEFRAGVGNPRRLKFAAEMMLRSRHAQYVDFLNEHIKVNDHATRHEGVRVLQEMGNKDSVDAMFALLDALIQQDPLCTALKDALNHPNKSPIPFLRNLADTAKVEKPVAHLTGEELVVTSNDIRNSLGPILDAFHLSGDVRKKVRRFVTDILSSHAPSAFDESRMNQTLVDYQENLNSLQHHTIKAMGETAYRTKDEGFLERLEQFFPKGDPRREINIVSALAGFRTEGSLSRLLENVDAGKDPDVLAGTLDALQYYQPDSPPKGLDRLCRDENNNLLRQKALNLLGQWNLGHEIINGLLESKSVSVCSDGLKTIGTYKIKLCLPKVLQLLKKETPDSVTMTSLETLRSFKDPKSCDAVIPYLKPPHTLSIRKTALETLHRAGGNDSFQAIIRACDQNPPADRTELVEGLLDILLTASFEEIQEGFSKHREFWIHLLEADNRSIQNKVIKLLEQFEPDDETQIRIWHNSISKTLKQFSGKTITNRERRLQSFVEKLNEKLKVRAGIEKRNQRLDSLVQSLETPNFLHKIQALRNLNQSYSAEMFAEHPKGQLKLVAILGRLFDAHQDNFELSVLLISLASKIRHPVLNQKLKLFSKHKDPSLAGAAEKALNQPIARQFVNPIQSVFVMDDSRYITNQLIKVLEQANFKVETSNDVTQGLQMLQAFSFDLLILDYYMPKLNGMEFLLEARKKSVAPKRTLVITSARNKDELQQFLEMDIHGVMLKPFRMEEFLQRIKDVERKS